MHNFQYNMFGEPVNEHGVKIRRDGKGDGWSNAHRDELYGEFNFNMLDLDCFFGIQAFGHNTANKLFIEYVPPGYEEKKKGKNRFGIVAIFDRKTSEEQAFGQSNWSIRNCYMHLARVISESQVIPCKFFYVIGTNCPPWKMIEMDIEKGGRKQARDINTGDWNMVWEELGLTGVRRQLVDWLKRK